MSQAEPEELDRQGLSRDEYQRAVKILGRPPRPVELAIFAVMWSEHCSYKSSRLHLKTFPTTGPQVLQGPGENAGAIHLGEDVVAVFKMESHNHPSFIEPYQGAATGVGGILRDIFTMGARPVACLNSLRFGSLDRPRMRYLVSGVVSGIGGYGNCMGIPMVGGEVTFHPSFNDNILVNAFSLGLARRDGLFLGKASGAGNPVIYVGSRTGRDGIHGATMASQEFDDTSEARRPTVQVGDPFTEKLLLEACLELFKTDAVVGIQDMGAAGLTCSSLEMASRGGAGVEMDLDRVPLREAGMTAAEIMLSESQERMLLVAREGREDLVMEIFRRWDLEAEMVGRVTADGHLRVLSGGLVVVDLPARPLAEEAPLLDRPRKEPAWLADRVRLDLAGIPEPSQGGPLLKQMLASPNLCSRQWITQQYDTSVRTNTVQGPGGDAALVRIKGTTKALALTSDCNPRYCHLNPSQGAALAVAEASLNISCVGGTPLAISDCLNFGNPERPEIMWQFQQAVSGLGAACRALDTPVVSGNVSFYNETEGQGIHPVPTVAMVGLLEEADRHARAWFCEPGDQVLLLGTVRDEIGASEYLALIHGLERGRPPFLDLQVIGKTGCMVRESIRAARLQAAHDLSEGGLAVALAEACFGPSGTGAEISVPSAGRRLDTVLFGESSGRILLTARPTDLPWLEKRAADAALCLARLGVVGGDRLRISVDGSRVVDEAVDDLRQVWEAALPSAMAGE